jgi:glycosyltransferase involved in cell wall biosynthesis
LKLITKFLDDNWNVDVVMTTGGGDFESEIDNRANIKYLRDKASGRRFLNAKGFFQKLLALGDLITYLFHRIQGFFRKKTYLNKDYDAAMVSLHGLDPDFCLNYVKAKTTVQWVRNDLKLCDPQKKAHNHIIKCGEQMDYYLCVATTTYKSFCDLYPELKHKARMVYNMLEPEKMLGKADEGINPYIQYPGDLLKFVTVCRVSDKSKGLLRMMKQYKKLLNEGYDFMWFIVGDGTDRALIEQEIAKLGLENRMIMVGLQPNPYPYYKYADVSATLSYYEGLCGTVNEAKVLGKPIIATRFSGVEEQLENGVNGLVVENNGDAIYEGLKRIVTDQELREKITNNHLPEAIVNDAFKLNQLKQLFK